MKTNTIYSNSFEFRDKSNTGTEYTYDNNGNMIRDLNSKIEFIEYDKLDHPIRIQFMDGSNIQYVYAANGRKLKVTHQTAVDNTIVAADRKLDLSESQLKSQTVQYYMGNFVLTNGILDRYYFGSDGYAKFTNGKPVYSSRTKGYTYSTVNSSDVLLNPEYRVTQNVYPYYFVKNHLGSNRMVADNPSTMVSYYPYGGIYYDDILFYQADDSHLYNGKEMDRMYGLDTYDHGARQYNPARITWDRMDQLAEKYYNVSPYVYCAGNPIRFIDSNGLEPTPAEAARIAKDVYNKVSQLSGPWRRVSFADLDVNLSSENTGFQSAIYGKWDEKNKCYSEYVYATAGTNPLRVRRTYPSDSTIKTPYLLPFLSIFPAYLLYISYISRIYLLFTSYFRYEINMG